jgi:hypothetical protein
LSNAASNASAFYEQVVKDGSVFTVIDDDSFVVILVGGTEVVPFWSSRYRVKKVQSSHPKYAGFSISEIPLTEFLDKTLAQLEEENIHVGVNWSGKRLIGYDRSVADLKRNIGYWLDKKG